MSLNVSLKSVLLFALIFLAACGGAPNNNPNYLERNGLGPDRRDVSVTVSGSSGQVDLLIGGRTVSFPESGTSVVEGFLVEETITASISSAPEGETCLFLPSALTEITVGTNLTVQCGAPTLTGEIKNFLTDATISNAVITVTHQPADTPVTFATVNSDGEGLYSVPDIIIDDPLSVTINATGYAPYTALVTASSIRPFVVQNVFLMPQNSTQSQDPSATMNFTLNGITVLSVPANGLETVTSGAAPTGNISAHITLLDASSEPRILSGRYLTDLDEHVESFGAISIILRDASDNELALASGVNATITIPTATQSINAAPASAFIYNFNQDTGKWTTPTAATNTLAATDVYTATLSTLSDVYIVANIYATDSITGCLEDSRGNRIRGAQIISQGRNYIGLAFTETDNDGGFSVPVKTNASALIYGLVRSRSRTQEVDTAISNSALTDCLILDEASTVITLTWGENPRDLDSHLDGPTTDGNTRFHIYFGNTTAEVNGVNVFLDIDDVSSYGPEVTTIPSFPTSGTYQFLVDHFSGSSDILNSPARVEVNMAGRSFAFSPPAGPISECWHVFDIVVDSTLNGTITPASAWVTRDECSNGVTLSAP